MTIRVKAPPPENCSEAKWKKWVDDVAKAFGWRTMHVYRAQLADGSWRTTTSATGWPDWTAVRGHRLLFVEFKGRRGKVDPDQDAWLDDLADVCEHVEVFVWRPQDWEEVARVLAPEHLRA